MPTAQILDLSHHDAEPDFSALKAAGIVGVILKATEGSVYVDHRFEPRYQKALDIFGAGCVHSYHMLDGSGGQIDHYLKVTDGKPGRWLDYELASCTLPRAVESCHLLAQAQGRFPGMYGSDKGQLGVALLQGHFTVCPLWIARYGARPLHRCDLWQFQAGENQNAEKIAGRRCDANVYLGSMGAALWMKSLCLPPTPVARTPIEIDQFDRGI